MSVEGVMTPLEGVPDTAKNEAAKLILVWPAVCEGGVGIIISFIGV